MGWSFYHRSKGQSHAEHFAGEINANLEILASAAKGGTFYAAVRNKDTGEVFALVNLFQWAPRDYFNFGVKWMDETVGPCEDECPAKILDLLTPTESKWANEWRERCRANLTRAAQTRSKSKTVKDGATIKIDRTLTFGKGYPSADTFKLRVEGRKRRWIANPGTDSAFMCRLPQDWAKRYAWEIVP